MLAVMIVLESNASKERFTESILVILESACNLCLATILCKDHGRLKVMAKSTLTMFQTMRVLLI